MSASGNALPINCLDCSLHTLCLVAGLNAAELDQLTGMVSTRRTVKRGTSLYKAGDRFEAIYPVRLGSFKARVVSPEGREQIIGFPLPGDLLEDTGAAVANDVVVALHPFPGGFAPPVPPTPALAGTPAPLRFGGRAVLRAR